MPRVKKQPQPTQELAKQVIDEVRAKVEKGSLIVYAEFEGYKVGDVYHVPEGWARDDAYVELLYTKQKKREGICFMKPDGNRVVLPVKE